MNTYPNLPIYNIPGYPVFYQNNEQGNTLNWVDYIPAIPDEPAVNVPTNNVDFSSSNPVDFPANPVGISSNLVDERKITSKRKKQKRRKNRENAHN